MTYYTSILAVIVGCDTTDVIVGCDTTDVIVGCDTTDVIVGCDTTANRRKNPAHGSMSPHVGQ